MISDHEIVWTFDRNYVRGEAHCNAPLDASCRNMPECNCEQWPNLQRDDQGWFHNAYGPLAIIPDGVHRHTQPSECNICLWLNESDIEECTAGNIAFKIGVTPVEFSWAEDRYEWKPA